MSKWEKYFSDLKLIAKDFASEEVLLCHSEHLGQLPSNTNHSHESVSSTSLNEELTKGLETTFLHLTENKHGWSYNGIPVIAFGVNVMEVTDSQQRLSFYHTAHLSACCSALNSSSRSVWITSDSSALKKWHNKASFEICHHCLRLSNFKNYRSSTSSQQNKIKSDFNFREYVKWNNASYFPDIEHGYWKSGGNVVSLEPGTYIESEEIPEVDACKHCQWPLTPHQIHQSKRIKKHLGINYAYCICCLEQKDHNLIINELQLLIAYAKRFEAWRSAYIKEQKLTQRIPHSIKFSWNQIAQHFPIKWQPLLSTFKQFEPADIYTTVDNGFALLAWPRLKRAIVYSNEDKEGFSSDWQVWTYKEVLDNI